MLRGERGLDRQQEWVGWTGRHLNCEESGQRSPHWEGHPFGKGLEGGKSFWKGLEEGERLGVENMTQLVSKD